MSKAGIGGVPFPAAGFGLSMGRAEECKGPAGMSGDDDLIKLYSQRILALAADIPLTERLPRPAGHAPASARRSAARRSRSTSTLEDGRIAAFGQDVKACALGQASASVLGRHVIGASREEIAAARDALAAMLKAGGPAPGRAVRGARGAAAGARLPQPARLDPAGLGRDAGRLRRGAGGA